MFSVLLAYSPCCDTTRIAFSNTLVVIYAVRLVIE